MVEITAINHKLLFEITALISPSTRKEKDRRVVQGGEDGAAMGSPGLGGGSRGPRRDRTPSGMALAHGSRLETSERDFPLPQLPSL